MEHSLALSALLYLPIALILFLISLEWAASRNKAASQIMARLTHLPIEIKIILLILSMSITVHLGLIPAHKDEIITAALFALDALALTGCGIALIYEIKYSSLILGMVLAAGIFAYILYVSLSWESADSLGLGTKFIEGVALLLIMIQRKDGVVLLHMGQSSNKLRR